jgi:uncharacterized small protein (DUF1192 family)
MINQHEHQSLAGPAADEAARRLEEFGEEARFQGTVVLDRRRLDRLMKRGDPAIYPGKYATCVHRHEMALCQQRRDSGGQIRPDVGGCQPLSCRNVALTTDNIDNLQQEIERIDAELAARPLLSPLLHGRLLARREEIVAFLARHNSQEAAS